MMKILSVLVLLLFASLPAKADNVEVAGTANWVFSSDPVGLVYSGGGQIVQTFSLSFDYNTVSQIPSDISVSSSGPMGSFWYEPNFYTPGGFFNFTDSRGDGIQVGNLYIGNPLLPFPELGSQLQIVLDFCASCDSHGEYVGQGGTVQVTPEPSTLLMLVPTLLALFFVGLRRMNMVPPSLS
jgi:hypothetical protein